MDLSTNVTRSSTHLKLAHNHTKYNTSHHFYFNRMHTNCRVTCSYLLVVLPLLCVHTIFSTYTASWSITLKKALFTRYCQSLVDKLTFSDWVSWFLTEMCSDRAPSFVQNVRKSGHGWYVFSNHFAVLIHSDSFSIYAYCHLIVYK